MAKKKAAKKKSAKRTPKPKPAEQPVVEADPEVPNLDPDDDYPEELDENQ
jgi:hypothetical protein